MQKLFRPAVLFPMGLLGGIASVFLAGAENEDAAAFIALGFVAGSCIIAAAILSLRPTP